MRVVAKEGIEAFFLAMPTIHLDFHYNIVIQCSYEHTKEN